jgi:hypothetical protein
MKDILPPCALPQRQISSNALVPLFMRWVLAPHDTQTIPHRMMGGFLRLEPGIDYVRRAQMLQTNNHRTSRIGCIVSYQMHLIEFRQIVRDAEVANAISPFVRRHRLTEAETEKFLLDLRIPRAANVARIVSLGL